MMAGDKVKVRTKSYQNDMVSFKNKNDILTVLIHLGYLAYDRKMKMAYIPNEEIRSEFVEAVEENHWDEFIEFERKSRDLLNATLDMDSTVVAENIEKIHMDYTSMIQYNDENSLSCTINLAFYFAREYYTIVREMPAGKGYADICMIPRKEHLDKPAVVIELKWDKSTVGALEQIKEKNYGSALKEYQGKLLLVGINYNRKTKKHECAIEVMEK